MRTVLPLFVLLCACSKDADGDGVLNDVDAFPDDPSEAFDSDGDGVGDAADAFPANPNASTDADGDGYGEDTDCNDNDASVNPSATEQPYNAVDDDCDASTPDDDIDDDGVLSAMDCNDSDPTVDLTQSAYVDSDGDGFGSGDTVELCVSILPNTHSAVDGDCDDADGSINPGAAEMPYDGIDQDCSGSDLWDVDGDGFTAIGAPDGSADDCDDQDASRRPGAREVYGNGLDDDCDAATDDQDADIDRDGFESTAAGGEDCDDQDPLVRPDLIELPDNGLDDDCVDGDLNALTAGGRYLNSAHPGCSSTGGDSPDQPACSWEALTLVDGDVVFVGGGPYDGQRIAQAVSLHGGYDGDWQRSGYTRMDDSPVQLPFLVNTPGEVVLTGFELVGRIGPSVAGLTVLDGEVSVRDLVVDVALDGTDSTVGGVDVLSELPFVGQDLFIHASSSGDAMGLTLYDTPTTLTSSTISVHSDSGSAVGLTADGFFAPFSATVSDTSIHAHGHTGAVGVSGVGAQVDLTRTDITANAFVGDVRAVLADGALDINVHDSQLNAEGGTRAAGVYGALDGLVITNSDVDARWGQDTIDGVSVDAQAVALTSTVIHTQGGADTVASGLVTTAPDGVSVRQSVIDLGPASEATAVWAQEGDTTIENTDIYVAFASDNAVGIVGWANVDLINTSIVNDGANNYSLGIDVIGSALSNVVHSVILPGVSDYSVGVFLPVGSAARVVNSVVGTGVPLDGESEPAAAISSGELEFADVELVNSALFVEHPDAWLVALAGTGTSVSSLQALEAGGWGGSASNTLVVSDSPFVSVARNDLHLRPDSELLAAGVDTQTIDDAPTGSDVDRDGQARTTFNLGLYETP